MRKQTGIENRQERIEKANEEERRRIHAIVAFKNREIDNDPRLNATQTPETDSDFYSSSVPEKTISTKAQIAITVVSLIITLSCLTWLGSLVK